MKAMDMVAASKLQKNKTRLKVSRPLFEESKRIIETLRICEHCAENEFIKPREVKRAVYVVITSDRGLCGGYNTNISQAAYEHMQKLNAEAQIIAFGSKGRDFFRRRRENILHTYPNLSETRYYEYAEIIGNVLLSMYLSEKVDEVYVAYTYFESALSYIPKVVRVLPLGEVGGRAKLRGDLMLYEPDPDHFLIHAVPMYLNAFLYDAMLEAGSSEQASRMVSMDSATKNATEIIDDLTLMFNRIRQSAITQEITEIVSGANVTK